MATVIDDPVEVGVVFRAGMARPAWFLWCARRYLVREVTMYWRTKQGRASLLHLNVTDGDNSFELVFNQETLVWRLAAVEDNDKTNR